MLKCTGRGLVVKRGGGVLSKDQMLNLVWGVGVRNNRKGGTASLRSGTCVKHNAVFGARFKGLSLYFYIKTGI